MSEVTFKVKENYTRYDSASLEAWAQESMDMMVRRTARYGRNRSNNLVEVDVFELGAKAGGENGVKFKENRTQRNTRLTLADPAGLGSTAMDSLTLGLCSELPTPFYLSLTERVADMCGYYTWEYTDGGRRNQAWEVAEEMLRQGRKLTWSQERPTSRAEAQLASKKKNVVARAEKAVLWLPGERDRMLGHLNNWLSEWQAHSNTLEDLKELNMPSDDMARELGIAEREVVSRMRQILAIVGRTGC